MSGGRQLLLLGQSVVSVVNQVTKNNSNNIHVECVYLYRYIYAVSGGIRRAKKVGSAWGVHPFLLVLERGGLAQTIDPTISTRKAWGCVYQCSATIAIYRTPLNYVASTEWGNGVWWALSSWRKGDGLFNRPKCRALPSLVPSTASSVCYLLRIFQLHTLVGSNCQHHMIFTPELRPRPFKQPY